MGDCCIHRDVEESPDSTREKRRVTPGDTRECVKESATESIPPRRNIRGKGEKARQELTAHSVTDVALKTPLGARSNRDNVASRTMLFG